MPNEEEVADYEFRLRIEAEENGYDIEDDEDNDVEVEAEPEPEIALEEERVFRNRCTVCLGAEARVVTIPCGHCCMCQQCSEQLGD